MHDWQSLTHVRLECKYHVVIVPKYRKKKLYGQFRERVGQIIKDLCRQRGIEFIEGHLIPYPHVFERSAQIQHSVCDRFFKRQERGANPSESFG